MYYFFTDETNKQISKDGEFFIFGGLIILPAAVESLDIGVKQIREKYGYKDEDVLKFSPKERPEHISQENFNKAKEDIINLAIKNKCLFIAYVIHHKVIKNELKNVSAISHLVGRFNKFLEENKSNGIVFIDRMDNPKEQFEIISDLFSRGILVESKYKKMPNILGYFVSCAKSSRLTSIADIILGGFRYSVNTQDTKNMSIAGQILKKIAGMMWGLKKADQYYVLEKGLVFRPQKILVKEYKEKYDTLLNQLNELLK